MPPRLLPLAALACALASGCLVREVQDGPRLDGKAKWVVLPMQNLADTPQAGERAEAIVATLLRARGVDDLRHYPALKDEGDLPELDEQRRYERALAWAKEHGFSYGVAGSVGEWRYRSGLDGEPAVGLTVQVVEVASGRVLWSATGARTGWGRDSVSGTAQVLLVDLLAKLRL